jgi:hypothetical protein
MIERVSCTSLNSAFELCTVILFRMEYGIVALRCVGLGWVGLRFVALGMFATNYACQVL